MITGYLELLVAWSCEQLSTDWHLYRVVFSLNQSLRQRSKIWYKGRKPEKKEGVVPDFNLQFATALTFYYRTKRFVWFTIVIRHLESGVVGEFTRVFPDPCAGGMLIFSSGLNRVENSHRVRPYLLLALLSTPQSYC